MIGEAHPDIERAGQVARKCYDAGIAALRPDATFGDVCDAMVEPVEAAGGWVRGPQIHGLNPLIGRARSPHEDNFPIDGIDQYPKMPPIPTSFKDMKLEPGMSFAFEPSCGFGPHVVALGGTVIVGEDRPIELNQYTKDILRA